MTPLHSGSAEILQLAQAVWDQVRERQCQPIATYRLEFHKEHLTFQDATDLVPYLAELGISHIYSCPYFQAAGAGSNSYAIVDPRRLNPDLGSEEDYKAFVAALKSHGMGQILDIVPNHMSTAVEENSWWTDLLEHGQSSQYAKYFDVDWSPVEATLKNRILLPVLGDDFGRVLEQGELKLAHINGKFQVHYFDHHFPVDPYSSIALWERLLVHARDASFDENTLIELESIITALRHLPERTTLEAAQQEERLRESKVIQARIQRVIQESPDVEKLLESTLNELNGDPEDPESFAELEQLLDLQVYRLSKWQAASDEINYRRFFDVNELAALCTENCEVFQSSHSLVFQLLINGDVDGVRIDHVDGLFHPAQYLWRMQWEYLERLAQQLCFSQDDEMPTDWDNIRGPLLEKLHESLGGPAPAVIEEASDACHLTESTPTESPVSELPLFVLVEKILDPDEPLPADWPVAGTTGYDFMNSLLRFFVKPEGFIKIQRNYRRFSGITSSYNEILLDSKRTILQNAMSSELQLLAHRLKRLTRYHRHTRDFTLNALAAALGELIVSFPVYRTYVRKEFISSRDRDVILEAVRLTRRRNPSMDSHLLDWIRNLLLGEITGSEEFRNQVELFVGRFQQVTSPVTAKGVEDTAFYQYFPLAAGNEVGGSPVIAPISGEEFHRENLTRLQHFPSTMLSTSTHDTKRSEDVRARISTLSEIPDQWRTMVGRWSRMNRHFRMEAHGEQIPSPNDEYLFYQTIVGMWPPEEVSEQQHADLVKRVMNYMVKATREEKVSTSWISPNSDYEAGVSRFVELALRGETKNKFLQEIRRFITDLLPAALMKSAASVLLKLTAPGFPDIYQGQEFWDDSLVDPDNRRPVDYASRRSKLRELIEADRAGAESRQLLVHGLVSQPANPALKQFLTWKVLNFRRENPELFQSGDYSPVDIYGPLAENFFAFRRTLGTASATVIVPRFASALLNTIHGDLTRFAEIGGLNETHILSTEPNQVATDLFTGKENRSTSQRTLSLAVALQDFPLGMLCTP